MLLGRAAAGVLIVAFALASCSPGSDDPEAAPSEPSQSTASTLSVAEVEAAITNLQEQPWGTVDLTVYDGAGTTIRGVHSSYDVVRQISVTAELPVEATSGADGYAKIESVDHGAVYLATRKAGPLANCWLQVATGPARVPDLPVPPRFPSSVRALWNLDEIHTDDSDGESAFATLPLVLAVDLINPAASSAVAPKDFGHPVPVALQISDGKLVGMRIFAVSVVDVLDDLGLALAEDLADWSDVSTQIDYGSVGRRPKRAIADDKPVISVDDSDAKSTCAA